MAKESTAKAVWTGKIKDGEGTMELGDGRFQDGYSLESRTGNGIGTNPEELLGAAHAGCFAMAFSAALSEEGFEPETIRARARVNLEKQDDGLRISTSHLEAEARIPGIDRETFQRLAAQAKTDCPVSQALAGLEISLEAKLVE